MSEQRPPTSDAPTTYVLSGTSLTETDFQNALSAGHRHITVAAGAVLTVSPGGAITVPHGATLHMKGSLVLGTGAMLINNSPTTFILDANAVLSGNGTGLLINGFDVQLASEFALNAPGMANDIGTMFLEGHISGLSMLFNFKGAVTLAENAALSLDRICNYDPFVVESGTSINATDIDSATGIFTQKAASALSTTYFSLYDGTYEQAATATLSAGKITVTNGTVRQNGTVLFTDSDYSVYAPYDIQNNSQVTIGSSATVNVTTATNFGSNPVVSLASAANLVLQTGRILVPGGASNVTKVLTEDAGTTVSIPNATINSTSCGSFLTLKDNAAASITDSSMSIGGPLQLESGSQMSVQRSSVATTQTGTDAFAYKVSNGLLSISGGTHRGIMAENGGSVNVSGNATIMKSDSDTRSAITLHQGTVTLNNCTVTSTVSTDQYLIDVVQNTAMLNIHSGAKLIQPYADSVLQYGNHYDGSTINGGILRARDSAYLVRADGALALANGKIDYRSGFVSTLGGLEGSNVIEDFINMPQGNPPVLLNAKLSADDNVKARYLTSLLRNIRRVHGAIRRHGHCGFVSGRPRA